MGTKKKEKNNLISINRKNILLLLLYILFLIIYKMKNTITIFAEIYLFLIIFFSPTKYQTSCLYKYMVNRPSIMS